VADFALLAKAADGLAQADGERGDGFQSLLAALREAAIVFAENFGEQEFGIAQDPGERIVHFVAKQLTEGFAVGIIGRTDKAVRFAGYFSRLAQAARHHFQGDGQTIAGTCDEVCGAGGDQRGQLRLLVRSADNHHWSVHGQRGDNRIQTQHFGHGSFTFDHDGIFLEQDNGWGAVLDDTMRGGHAMDGGNPQASFFGFEFTAGGGAKFGVVANQQDGVFPDIDHLGPRCILFPRGNV
jgi:hypothetical protein